MLYMNNLVMASVGGLPLQKELRWETQYPPASALRKINVPLRTINVLSIEARSRFIRLAHRVVLPA